MLTFQEIHERNCAIHEAIEAVCPIDGISFAADDPSAWKIQPKAEATREQINAAQALLASFDTAKAVEKTAKKKRKDAIAAMDADVVKLLRAMHVRLMVIEHSRQTFDEWRDYVLGVADLQSPTKK